MKSRLRVASSVGRPERQGGTYILAGNVEFPTPFAMVVQNDAGDCRHGRRCPMTIMLNHTIVPARDKDAAARFFAQLFGLSYGGPEGHFAPVRLNDTLTLLFDDDVGAFDSHHYAFHVSDAEFDAVLARVQAAGLPFGSVPWHAEDGKLNDWNGGRGFYFKDIDGHLLELMTVPQ
jgi:catechol 2,3-dioxygenase-like lactoylglutathione lyase family enzyme